MLAGFKAGSFEFVMGALSRAPYVFHLTGSRYFGYHQHNSDWDFFVEVPDKVTGKLHEWLADNGFKKESNDSYVSSPPDPLNEVLEVWVHLTANVHVQIVHDVATKIAVQEAIRSVPGVNAMLGNLGKEQRKVFWRTSRAIFSAGRTFQG